MLGNAQKKVWFYSITDYIPNPNYISGIYQSLWKYGVNDLSSFDMLDDYNCLIYYYEDEDVEIDKDIYNILYENNAGLIIEKKG